MRKGHIATIAVVAAVLVYAAFVALHGPSPAPATVALPSATEASNIPRESRVSPLPTSSAGSRQAQSASTSGPLYQASVRDRLMASSDWKDIFDRIDRMAEVPPSERLFYKALILDTCSNYRAIAAKGEPEVNRAVEQGTLAQLSAYVRGLMKDEQQKAAMEFNLQRRIVNVCRGFGAYPVAKQDVERAYREAAAAGDPKAQAQLIALRLAQSAAANAGSLPKEYEGFIPPGEKPIGFPDPITPGEQHVLTEALFSGDPLAIRTAGELLSMGSDQQSLRFGPDQIDIGPRTDEIWTLVACDFGFECGPHNMAVSFACAEQRRCAADYAGYLRDFVMTPAEFEAVQSTAAAISDAIRRGDRSAFQLVPQPGSRRTLYGGPSRISIR